MNSLKHPYHIRLQDLQEFLCNYSRASAVGALEWAEHISKKLHIGHLVFLLKPVAAGVDSVNKNSDPKFAVTGLAIVVRINYEKAVRLNRFCR